MSTRKKIIVWFRNDLRLDDHVALHHAVSSGAEIIPVYLHTPHPKQEWQPGGATRWWLHHALADLQTQFRKHNATLILRSGQDPLTLLRKLLEETGADLVVWNRRYEPYWVDVDTRIKRELNAKSFVGSVLREPGAVSTNSGTPYKVFTPFYKAYQAQGVPEEPLDIPTNMHSPESTPETEVLENWRLLPEISWDSEFYSHWDPTVSGAEACLNAFSDERMDAYKNKRDFPNQRATSELSPYLHFGQISPRRVWHHIKDQAEVEGGIKGGEAYLRQLVWRDFAIQMLFHFPHTDSEPLQEKYAAFPWKKDPEALNKWQRGQTGYPIIDAGMRQLWATGWMHNRVRMIVASFLVKDLLISWQEGAEWFWDTLVDADLANNTFGWQWAGGCGADAAPYFRIFNPMLQSKKFDPEGAYIRRWVPELRDVNTSDIHAPWESKTPPKDYPPPMVNHSEARDLALEALGSLSENS
jgi:deoxyribodipyrimidine photo-lyase